MSEYRPPSAFGMIPPVVKNILIINVICFLAQLNPMMNGWLTHNGAAFYFDSPNFRIWQLFTYAFLHGSSTHLFFNMFAVFVFGPPIENYLGSKRFLTYYMLTAIGAILLQSIITGYQVYSVAGTFFPIHQGIVSAQELPYPPVIGASGAVFGILIAFGMLFPNMLLYLYFLFPIKAKYLVIAYGAFELFYAVQNNPNDNVAHYAHLGGMLFGFILLKVWKIRKPGSYY
ncbi:rhomboid family intramembrane serine protease [Solitalea sp. MAHUQ-68]|uniref:Rhomboid family intramembrane serine protease n=1 Tax=Solitalea agri TaxID=2953739 RepID=A0A9X2F1W8_9SPHI|nr:rhomboid family intramembrane serine protease [Solitalea agri]MCO4293159.1 rhomboid family intramembrane serine protease [Solitalea agri]